MLCDLYAILERGTVYVVDDINVECCGLFLILPKKTQRFFECLFSIFDCFYFLNCLMVIVLQKTPWNPGVVI